MTVELSMTAKMVNDAIVVPTAAVFKNSEGADYVLLAGSDEKAHQRPVQLGVQNSEITQITKGISPGDPVITGGGYAVPDGAQIKVEKPGADEKESAAGDDTKDETDHKADKADKPNKPANASQPEKALPKAALPAKAASAKGKE